MRTAASSATGTERSKHLVTIASTGTKIGKVFQTFQAGGTTFQNGFVCWFNHNYKSGFKFYIHIDL
jgi:hypothetical protein